MKITIKKFCEDTSSDNGLLLIDSPTGAGKTHSVLDFIYEATMDEQYQDKKIFFITTQKKNLPQRELEERFKRNGQLDKFKEKFLFIDSNIDAVISGFDNEVERNIPADLKKLDEYKKFADAIRTIRKCQNSYDMKSIVTALSDELRIKFEPAFRKAVANMLSHETKTVKAKLQLIHTDKRWQWVGKLYPGVFLAERQIIFMSMDKFMLRNGTPLEPSYHFYNSKYTDGAIVFIDEFDATKETLLNSIIKNSLQGKADYIYLFQNIYNALMTKKFPRSMTKSSEQRKQSRYKDQSLESVIDSLRQKAKKIHDDYSLELSHRTILDDNESMNNNFLFQDHQYHSILNGKKSYVCVEKNTAENINEIRFVTERPKCETLNVHNLLGSLRGFISYFIGAVNIIAINYTQCKQEKRKSNEDDTKHDMHSTIMMYLFQNTPEKLLLKICDRAKVIGISATASIETVLGNYDLRYLRHKMQGAFQQISPEDKKRMRDSFHESITGYKNVEIKTEIIGAEEYSEKTWMNIFDDIELCQYINNDLQRNTYEYDKGDQSYNQRRYYRIARAYKEFLIHDDIKSFLCVLTKHPKNGDRVLSLEKLHQIFKFISETVIGSYNKNSIVILTSEDFDRKKDDLAKRLESGEKIFVISVYQTIGAGQNLQYPIPNHLRHSLIHINSYPERTEKDFDAIYLDKPTNLLVQLGDELQEEDFAKYLYQVEFLQEQAEISGSEAFQHIRKAFTCFMNGRPLKEIYAKSLYTMNSVIALATRTMIQAVGRICRTNMKNKTIYIYADSKIASVMDMDVADRIMLNPEFERLLDECRKYNLPDKASYSYKNAGELTSKRVYKFIMNLLSEEWNDKRMKNWRDLRNTALTYPTCSKSVIESDFNFSQFYVELPERGNRLYYKQENDFNNVQIEFKQTYGLNKVSEESARLQALMSIPGIPELFKRNGWATCFHPNDYIIAPMMFQNIYKGALGEVIGKFIFETYYDVQLSEIEQPEIFERFDYRVNDTDIYVDFKHWQETTVADRKKQIEKIIAKAKICKAKCVITVNIIITDDAEYRIQNIPRDDISIVIIPALIRYKNGQCKIMKNAFEKVKECVRKYGNTYE